MAASAKQPILSTRRWPGMQPQASTALLSVVATYYGTRSSSTSKQALYSIKEIDREGACLVRVAVLSAAMLRPEAAAAPAP